MRSSVRDLIGLTEAKSNIASVADALDSLAGDIQDVLDEALADVESNKDVYHSEIAKDIPVLKELVHAVEALTHKAKTLRVY